MGLLHVASALSLASAAASQTLLQYHAAASNVTYGIAIPDSPQPFDVLLQIVAPITVGWAGFALGGDMLRDPLVVAWANGNTAVVSPRYTT